MGKMYSIEEQTLTDIINVPREILNIGSEQKFPPSEFPNMINNAVGYIADQVGQGAYQSGLEEGYNTGYGTAMSEVSETINNAYQGGLAEGYNNGYGEGTSNGISIGKEQQYNEFWDNHLSGGTRTDFRGGFGAGWNDSTFKPPINSVINAKYADRMFAYSSITDLKAICDERNVTIDFSTNSNSMAQLFMGSAITRIGVINVSNNTSASYLLYDGRRIVYVEKVILSTSGSQKINNNTFMNCEDLVDIDFEGVIGETTSFQWSKSLSHDSFVNIFRVLSTTSSGTSLTVSKEAVNKAFETSEGANDGSTSAEWLTLTGTRTNWTIALA